MTGLFRLLGFFGFIVFFRFLWFLFQSLGRLHEKRIAGLQDSTICGSLIWNNFWWKELGTPQLKCYPKLIYVSYTSVLSNNLTLAMFLCKFSFHKIYWLDVISCFALWIENPISKWNKEVLRVNNPPRLRRKSLPMKMKR